MKANHQICKGITVAVPGNLVRSGCEIQRLWIEACGGVGVEIEPMTLCIRVRHLTNWQGWYRSWKSLKVLDFQEIIIQAWKVLEF